MHRLSASVLFLLAGTITLAQTSSNPPTAPKNLPNNTSTNGQTLGATVRSVTNSNFACPVGFFASRQVPIEVTSINDATPAEPAQGLHLTLKQRKTPAIQSVEVTVYGTSLKGHYFPVDSSQSTDTVSKTFELHRTSDDTSLSEADVWMHLVGSLRWADLISITYADGTTWHATENFKCRAIPSNFLLVGTR